jgi:hypothetical protein
MLKRKFYTTKIDLSISLSLLRRDGMRLMEWGYAYSN